MKSRLYILLLLNFVTMSAVFSQRQQGNRILPSSEIYYKKIQYWDDRIYEFERDTIEPLKNSAESQKIMNLEQERNTFCSEKLGCEQWMIDRYNRLTRSHVQTFQEVLFDRVIKAVVEKYLKRRIYSYDIDHYLRLCSPMMTDMLSKQSVEQYLSADNFRKVKDNADVLHELYVVMVQRNYACQHIAEIDSKVSRLKKSQNSQHQRKLQNAEKKLTELKEARESFICKECISKVLREKYNRETISNMLKILDGVNLELNKYRNFYDAFIPMMKHYRGYNKELGEFLQCWYDKAKDNGFRPFLSQDVNRIKSELKRLEYWTYYENRDNTKYDYASIVYLDTVITDYLKLLDSSARDFKEHYKNILKRLAID